MRWIILMALAGLSLQPLSAVETPRQTRSLNGEWQFVAGDLQPALANIRWQTVTVPQAWEQHEGMAFDGIGWYRKTLDPIDLKPNRRLLLHFDAVATHAAVYWNGTKLGEHLGPWTPFRFDVTEAIRKAPMGPHVIDVRVDEKVGHNTQGFLPIIQPHFGGIWQEVKLIEVPDLYIDDLKLRAFGDPSRRAVEITVHASQPVPANTVFSLEVHGQANEPPVIHKNEILPSADPEQDHWSCSIPLNHMRLWSHLQPQRYRLVVSMAKDRVETTAAFRTIETKGDQFLLNGQPLSIRGVLNWGYYPPDLAPNPDPEVWRKDLQLIKSWGFNLMKCCLWVPPKRFLEIADEEGVLIWMEYPTWHPKLDQKHREELVREYTEFFHHDRNHPSVILRSLTCETGHQADIKVIQELYDLGKTMIPGSLIVDDSSWIEWNRVYDFFDDHPYGNNHTWAATLKRLKDYIAKKGTKPLALGEAIAADTWVNPDLIDRVIADRAKLPGAKHRLHEARGMPGRTQPYWAPISLEASRTWLKRMAMVVGQPIDQERLTRDSLRYAWLMRKYQIEAFRREVPHGGYVVSVLRDFPLASMGLIGYDGVPKWTSDDWAWHGEKKREGDPWPKPPALPPLQGASPANVKVVDRLDEALLAELEAGAKVLLLPSGKEGSFPLKSHWFLRGGPFVNTNHPLIQHTQGLHELLVDQQHFDLAGDVIPDVPYLEEIDPILMLWDTHDIPEVKTHGLVFETRIGKGRLLVSALRHGGDNNPAGARLKERLLQHLDQGPLPRNALKPETLAGMKAKLREKKVNLAGQPWKFKPDPKDAGLQQGWHQPGLSLDDQWQPIQIGRSWEGQGHATLDGWAWYRLEVAIPNDWPEGAAFLHCDGADDYVEFYLNGQKVGSMGELETRKTAFDDKASFRLPVLKPGAKVALAARVHDWHGAGGLHRPLWLSTSPRPQGPEVLK